MACRGEGGAALSLHPPSPRLVGTGQAVPSQCWMCRAEGGCVGWILVLWAPGAMAKTQFVGRGQGGTLCPPPSVTLVATS